MSEIASGIKSARTLRLVSDSLAAIIGDGVDMGYMGSESSYDGFLVSLCWLAGDSTRMH
jgi:hypothetical protein